MGMKSGLGKKSALMETVKGRARLNGFSVKERAGSRGAVLGVGREETRLAQLALPCTPSVLSCPVLS